MGKILKIHNKMNDKVEITLEMNRNEVKWLNGSMDNISVFSEDNLTESTRLVQRGRKESTKYFLMPKNFKTGILLSNTIPCTRIEKKTKYIYLFMVNKY
jgi:hypothetical protein